MGGLPTYTKLKEVLKKRIKEVSKANGHLEETNDLKAEERQLGDPNWNGTRYIVNITPKEYEHHCNICGSTNTENCLSKEHMFRCEGIDVDANTSRQMHEAKARKLDQERQAMTELEREAALAQEDKDHQRLEDYVKEDPGVEFVRSRTS
ncbi:hypothetical protein EJ08DRAFT_662611 [Tothia fuscella]|uniref:Uncharacterized protein n=1 Tax=Tothia fuscella TaxID=1048955 RepID=A0A9P4NMD6_9PEZI|nr:hypothetical protein EJ08DRAFT_662611 [Tothia fuscella]